MGLLDSLLANPARQQDYHDFAARYAQGAPHEGYSDQEVGQRYQQVAANLSPQEYQDAAEQAYARLSPQERLQFAQYLQQQAQAHGSMGFGQGAPVQQYQDPRALAQATAQLQQQQPGVLSGLLGGGGGGALANPLARAALAGIAAMAVSRVMGGGGQTGAGAVAGGTRYRIANLASRKLLANPQGSRDDGTRIIQWDPTGGMDQQWVIDRGPHGGVRIANAASAKLLADPEGSRNNGTEIIQWQPTGGPEQEWNLEVGQHGGVRIRNLASRLLLANPQGSSNNGTVMVQWQDDGGPEQEWMFDPPLR
jgi:Ricin-type beta-trefoil lectin domain-like